LRDGELTVERALVRSPAAFGDARRALELVLEPVNLFVAIGLRRWVELPARDDCRVEVARAWLWARARSGSDRRDLRHLARLWAPAHAAHVPRTRAVRARLVV